MIGDIKGFLALCTGILICTNCHLPNVDMQGVDTLWSKWTSIQLDISSVLAMAQENCEWVGGAACQ
jgi:hypothetical protein